MAIDMSSSSRVKPPEEERVIGFRFSVFGVRRGEKSERGVARGRLSDGRR